MDRLVSVIGPAPSELSLEDYLAQRLIPERSRVTEELIKFRNQVTNPKKKKAKARKAAKPRGENARILALLKEKGISPEEFRQILLKQPLEEFTDRTPNQLPKERQLTLPKEN